MAGMGLLGGAAVVAGLGLLKGKSWSWRLLVGYCGLTILFHVGYLVLELAVVKPTINEWLARWGFKLPSEETDWNMVIVVGLSLFFVGTAVLLCVWASGMQPEKFADSRPPDRAATAHVPTEWDDYLARKKGPKPPTGDDIRQEPKTPAKDSRREPQKPSAEDDILLELLREEEPPPPAVAETPPTPPAPLG